MALPTDYDYKMATAFAMDQIIRAKCKEKSMCDKDEECVVWKNRPDKRKWNPPCYYGDKKCENDSDCAKERGGKCTDKGVCGYCPRQLDEIDTGECFINSERLCSLQGAKDGMYYDWVNPACTKNTICPNGKPCKNERCTCTTDNDCDGAQKCVNGECTGNACIIGNLALKNFCEKPSSRAKIGLQDDPAFFFDRNKSKCYITPQYCTSYGLQFSGKKCADNKTCAPDETCYQGHCVGPRSDCTTTTGQDVAEFVVGKTLYRAFEKGTRACVPSDIDISAKKMMAPDFVAPGINLYNIQYKDGRSPAVSVVSEEVEKVYPQYIVKESGKTYLHIEEIQDNHLKRLLLSVYLGPQMNKWLTLLANE